MYIVGAVIVLAAIAGMVKRMEPRMLLLVAGILMCLVVLNPMAAFDAFRKSIAGPVIQTIAGAMAFAYVMTYTKADQHLVHMLSNVLTKLSPVVLVPGGILITAFVHISVPSAAGCVASVGPVLAPILLGAGVAPVMVASILFCGTFGMTMLNPGFHQIAVVSQATGDAPAAIVANHFTVVCIVSVVVIAVETFVAFYLKEQKGYGKQLTPEEEAAYKNFKVNYLWALTPLLPLVLIMLGSTGTVAFLKPLKILDCMLIGAIALCVVTKTNPAKISIAYWEGFGKGITNIYSIIICSAVFVAGIQVTGLLQKMLDAMASNPALARITGSLGPFILAVVCGSGDAASVAFNQLVTPHAAEFGMIPMDLGALAAFTGCLGRTMSPFAGVTFVCMGLTGTTSPIEMVKRTAPAMLAGLLVATVLFAFR